MRYISLNNNSLSYFTTKGELSELSGSSRYQIFDNELIIKQKRQNNKIENESGLTDYLQYLVNDKMTDDLRERIILSYESLIKQCMPLNFPTESMVKRLKALKIIVNRMNELGSSFVCKSKIIDDYVAQSNSRYQIASKKKSEYKKLNKSKVKGKMYALFNLRQSKKFIAFYSVSFPLNSSDDSCFECWNSWLTYLRKKCGLTHYIWISERQKNGTLHYHMLTNNYMPILATNRAMAIIIDNKVKEGYMNWLDSSLDRYNGVDVDCIFNSKRHKKTGSYVNPSQVRDWVAKYVTKYVTKNNESFKHLCWHCSHSVSELFTSRIELFENRDVILRELPNRHGFFKKLVSDFNTTFIFMFVPPPLLFDKIISYNNYITNDFDNYSNKVLHTIKFNTTTL